MVNKQPQKPKIKTSGSSNMAINTTLIYLHFNKSPLYVLTKFK